MRGRYYVPYGWSGLSGASGAAPRRAPTRRGPRFSRETGKEPEERFSSGLPYSGLEGPCGGPLFSAWPAAHKPTPVTARPQLGGLGGVGVAVGKGRPPPKPSPRGSNSPGTVRSGPGEATINHRCPSAHTGADEAIDSPNGAGEERRWGDRPIFLQGKVGYRIAPHRHLR